MCLVTPSQGSGQHTSSSCRGWSSSSSQTSHVKCPALDPPHATSAMLLWKQHVDFPVRPPALPYSTGFTTTVPGTHRGRSHRLLTKYLGPNLKLRESYGLKTQIWGTWEPQLENYFIFLTVPTKKFPFS